MISEKMQKELNDQINAELFSSYLYLAMAAYFDDLNFTGFSTWMTLQSQEEYDHAMKFYAYVSSVGGRVTLDAIEKPQAEWGSPKEAFEAAQKHEQYVTGRINNLVNLAVEEKDHATNGFLQWFVTEQIEEEATVNDIVAKFDMISDSKNSLYFFDRELGKRTAAPA